MPKPKKAAKPAATTSTPAPVPTPGRIVLFTLLSGEVRPAVIVRRPEVAEVSPEVEHQGVDEEKPGTGTRADAAERRQAAANVTRKPSTAVNLHLFLDGPNDAGLEAWIPNVPHDQTGKAAGTWHWPERV